MVLILLLGRYGIVLTTMWRDLLGQMRRVARVSSIA